MQITHRQKHPDVPPTAEMDVRYGPSDHGVCIMVQSHDAHGIPHPAATIWMTVAEARAMAERLIATAAAAESLGAVP